MNAKHKYKNKKVKEGKLTFDSAKEHRRYLELKRQEEEGMIADLQLQVSFEIAPSVMLYGRKRPARKYVADFVYTKNGQQIVEDVKGVKTHIYTLKRHLMMSVHGIQICET